jgi:hypothetical protein
MPMFEILGKETWLLQGHNRISAARDYCAECGTRVLKCSSTYAKRAKPKLCAECGTYNNYGYYCFKRVKMKIIPRVIWVIMFFVLLVISCPKLAGENSLFQFVGLILVVFLALAIIVHE